LHSIGIDQHHPNGKGSVMKIAILGTGMVGNAIGTKLVQLGHQVTMGSRTATSAAGQQWLRSVGGAAQIGTFADAAAFGDIVIDGSAGSPPTLSTLATSPTRVARRCFWRCGCACGAYWGPRTSTSTSFADSETVKWLQVFG
jgi:hypothetical protein